MKTASYDIQTSDDATISDYVSLLKPKVMSLVVFTGLAGMWAVPGFFETHPLIIFAALLSLAIGSGAAGAINMWYDHDIDAVMERTKNRAIPRGVVPKEEALGLGVVLSALSFLTMGLATNWVAAGILAFANLFYVFVYTMWLKRRTSQNIVIGGAAGAFPPMIGWAAMTGDVTLLPILLFAVIFLWTPPHFWALSLFSNEDYKRAGVPMLPCIAGEKSTKLQMLLYTLILLPVSVLPWFLGLSGTIYAATAFILGSFFVFTALQVYRDKDNVDSYKRAKQMFGYSVFYLFALFLGVMIDAA